MPYRDPSLSDADVYRQIRKGASPQSQQTLDNLVKALGLQKKMRRPRRPRIGVGLTQRAAAGLKL